MSPSSQKLDANWQFSQVVSAPHFGNVKEEWLDCAIPTSVHVELKKAGRIPDPFKGLAEWDVQWIQEAEWDFRTTFEVTSAQLDEKCADLVCEGLDTYCDIILNGTTIASTENMFIAHRIACKDHLKEGENKLVLHFRSAWYEAKKEESENGGPRTLWNGASNRLYSRKAQYGWGLSSLSDSRPGSADASGWDWGPVMMTVGPWRPISLDTYTYRFEDVRVDTDLLGPDYKIGTLKADIQLGPSALPSGSSIKAVLRDSSGTSIKEDVVSGTSIKEDVVRDSRLDWILDQGEIAGWYPINYGKQPLYKLELTVIDSDGKELLSSTTRVAFRHVRVVQEPLIDQEGTSFLFEVNGVRVFCGGSNWIPGDSFLTEMEGDRYRRWMDLMVEGNQNMLRIWAGGIYEDEALYDACDERGLVIWQDMMFGCGLYPSYPKINDNIKTEAESVVRRLRNHPSVVIFAGNNEDYQVAEAEKVMDYSDESGDYMNTAFPARHIYEVLLPEVVGRLSTIFYHRGSPYGGKDSKDKTVGDIHQWNVWHGSQEPWANWDKLGGRFVSEFGMQGYPDIRTVKGWDDDPAQLFPQSRVSANHNKADGFERRLELYLMENMRHAFDMPSYIYYTQIMQAECLAAAYRLWRRDWRGKGREYTAGALVWQLDDCWPCVSWAIVDYYLRPKPAFYSIARELRPYTVGMTRKDIKKMKDEKTEAFCEIDQELQLWGCNSTLSPKAVKVELVAFDLHQGETGRWSHSVTLDPNSSTEMKTLLVPGQPTRTSLSQTPKPIVVQTRLLDPETNEVLARYANWPEPWKFLIFPKDVGLKITVDGEKVTLECQRPIKGVVLDTKGAEGEVKWSDQGIDLFPGDVQVVTAKGLEGRAVVARYMGDGSA